MPLDSGLYTQGLGWQGNLKTSLPSLCRLWGCLTQHFLMAQDSFEESLVVSLADVIIGISKRRFWYGGNQREQILDRSVTDFCHKSKHFPLKAWSSATIFYIPQSFWILSVGNPGCEYLYTSTPFSPLASHITPHVNLSVTSLFLFPVLLLPHLNHRKVCLELCLQPPQNITIGVLFK